MIRLSKNAFRVPRARSLLARGTWAKHPYVILHELAHAYHDQVLGFNHPEVLKAYKRSEKDGLYERVLLTAEAKPAITPEPTTRNFSQR